MKVIERFKSIKPHPDKANLTKCKITAKGICFIMLATMGLSLIYSNTIQYVKQTQETAIESVKEEQFETIYTYLTELRDYSSTNVSVVAKNIEEDIRSDVDMDQLKFDMDNNTMNEELYNILKSNISDQYLNGINNYRNGIFVADSNGIRQDWCYTRSSNSSRDWGNEINRSYNKELEKDAIDKILNHSKDLIATEQINTAHLNNHRLITEMNKDMLKEIYMQEGLNGFRNYQFLIPAYITEQGDVFGQQDIVGGIKNKTHKIIIIQEFNLYDQIIHNRPDLANTNGIDKLSLLYTTTLNWLYILGCLYVICIILSLIYISSIYNSYIENSGLLE